MTGDLQGRAVPQLVRQIGAFLGHDQLDDRRDVEVSVQRR
jgi:hypothetical protein